MNSKIIVIGIITLLVLTSPGCLKRSSRGGPSEPTIVKTAVTSEGSQQEKIDKITAVGESLEDTTSVQTELKSPDVDLDFNLEEITTADVVVPEVISDAELAELESLINEISALETELFAGDIDLDLSL